MNKSHSRDEFWLLFTLFTVTNSGLLKNLMFVCIIGIEN